jgi:hypothetical protein
VICKFCNEETPDRDVANYCGRWDCYVAAAKELGGKTIAPNGLRICCVKADGTMMEHEHADHPLYKFPVEVEVTDARLLKSFEDDEARMFELAKQEAYVRATPFTWTESHAFIMTDGCMAVTLYETCYTMWYLGDGHCLGGFNERNKWKLTDESLEKVRAFVLSGAK